jgi:tetratricopeptide (TPR) repeat protein
MKNTTFLVVALVFSISSIALGSDNDAKWQKMVRDGESLLHEKKAQEAIDKYLDPVIEQFNSLNSTNSAQVYCARNSNESLAYMIQVAALQDKGDGKDVPELWGNRFAVKKDGAVVLSQFWAEAFYLKSYALLELGNIDLAKVTLKKAVGLSPLNSMYLAQLGHICQLEKNWDMALETYEASEEAVTFSHPDMQDAHRARAWRGLGYVYVELGKLKEAKEKYKQCLELNPNDQRAKAEIKYIEGLKAK